MAELKCCPFCGGDAEMVVGEYQPKHCRSLQEVPEGARVVRNVPYGAGRGWIEYREKCFTAKCRDKSCLGRVVRKYPSERQAEKAWNRRAGDGEAQ